MKLTLIITTYNWPEALFLVLESVERQVIKPDQLIIADDGSSDETRILINTFKNKSNLNIIHSWQEDKGFRAARSRNKAIVKSIGDYIILIDGDTILHRNFVKDHLKNAEPGFFVQGSRVLVSKKYTNKVLNEKTTNFSFFSLGIVNRKNSIHSKLLSFIFSNKKNQLRGIKTHNFAFYLKDCLNINGFNNEFEGWGREDSDFAARLLNSGIKRKNVRFNLIQFHLFHNDNSRASLEKNDAMLEYSIKHRIYWCTKGINSIDQNES